MNQTLLTTARWELLNQATGFSGTTKQLLLEYLNHEIGYPPTERVDVPFDSSPIAPLPPVNHRAKIAICLGHARDLDRGAVAFNGIDEETYNLEVMRITHQFLLQNGYEAEIIDYYEGGTYGKAMRWLANKLKAEDFTFAMELHFNSAAPIARGFEYLYWHKSKRGVIFAKTFQHLHSLTFPGKYDRGAEPLGDQAHERGVLFCSLTHCPAIICEPFFGTNPSDAESYMTPEGIRKLGEFYGTATIESLIEIHRL